MGSCKQFLLIVASAATLYILYCRVIISTLKSKIEDIEQRYTMQSNTALTEREKVEIDRDVWKARYHTLARKTGTLNNH